MYFSFALFLIIDVGLHHHYPKCIYYNWHTLRVYFFIPKFLSIPSPTFFLLSDFLSSGYYIVYFLTILLGRAIVCSFFHCIIRIHEVPVIIRSLFLLGVCCHLVPIAIRFTFLQVSSFTNCLVSLRFH